MDDAISFTSHALQRMNQRGLTPELIIGAMTYGRTFHRQGYEFYCVSAKDLRGGMRPAQSDRLKNLVVVCREGVVVTTYRNGDCFKNVRKKGKRECKG